MKSEREVLQMALEALESSIDLVRNDYESDWRHNIPTREKQLRAMLDLVVAHEDAITAIKEVLSLPKQEWHGLTDEEIRIAIGGGGEFDSYGIWTYNPLTGVKAIEAKLKEKNHG